MTFTKIRDTHRPMRLLHFLFALLALVCATPSTLGAASGSAVQSRVKGNVRIANDFPGADLGAKINAADKALGGAGGEVWVKNGGTITTQVIINSGHKLRFSAGVYKIETELLSEGAILLKSRTEVTGSGWDTIIVEPSKTGWIVFQSYEDARSQPVHSGADTDIRITNLQIRGANPAVEGGVRQTLALGNCRRCHIEGVWLNQTGVIGVQAGGNASKGNFADTVTIRKNLFTSVASQAAAVVNGRNVIIDENTFRDSGRVGANMGMTAIDLEPNDSSDIIQNIKITNNVIDSRRSGFLHGNGILVQNGARTLRFGPVLVQSNTVTGGNLTNAETGNIASGIYITGSTQDVEVANNIVRRVGHSGIRLENSTRNYVHGNTLVSTGSGGILSFEIINTTDSRIFDNVVTIDPGSLAATKVIQEMGTSQGNTYRGNTDGNTALSPITLGKSKILPR
ncbi:MAG: right-handed parallel beta-helix repeat-containing protein [Acidobacteriota bacterium]|nr:right-handed parallel beta-helix repeat-containing protein [Acidobacteriota bacterium]